VRVPNEPLAGGRAAGPGSPGTVATGPKVDLAEFLVSLGSQAMQALAARPAQLEQARTLIGVLEMLEDKTEGRRTTEESEVLTSLIYQLRLAYVDQARAGHP
jgi:hypothetical protein